MDSVFGSSTCILNNNYKNSIFFLAGHAVRGAGRPIQGHGQDNTKAGPALIPLRRGIRAHVGLTFCKYEYLVINIFIYGELQFPGAPFAQLLPWRRGRLRRDPHREQHHQGHRRGADQANTNLHQIRVQPFTGNSFYSASGPASCGRTASGCTCP